MEGRFIVKGEEVDDNFEGGCVKLCFHKLDISHMSQSNQNGCFAARYSVLPKS